MGPIALVAPPIALIRQFADPKSHMHRYQLKIWDVAMAQDRSYSQDTSYLESSDCHEDPQFPAEAS
jgi:hypothetical protein